MTHCTNKQKTYAIILFTSLKILLFVTFLKGTQMTDYKHKINENKGDL